MACYIVKMQNYKHVFNYLCNWQETLSLPEPLALV